jgi:sugar phosphate isomerase/epimerase
MLHAAETIGSGVVRCFFGMASDRLLDTPVAVQIDDGIRTLREVAPLAERLGIRIAVENHGMGDLLAPELRKVIEAVGSDHVGVCFDSGNPAYAAEDPVYAAEILAPYVVTSHIRDTRVWRTEQGAMAQWVPVGAGNVDLRRVLDILLEHAPDLAVNLEIITGGGPYGLPFLADDADFWRLFPDMGARSLARFLALAEQGTPEPFAQHLGADTDTATMQAQQRAHLEQSVTYCREVLKV